MLASNLFSALLMATAATARFTVKIVEHLDGPNYQCHATYQPSDDRVGVTLAPEGPNYCQWDHTLDQERIASDHIRINVYNCNNDGQYSYGYLGIFDDGNYIYYTRCGIRTCFAVQRSPGATGVIESNDDNAYAC